MNLGDARNKEYIAGTGSGLRFHDRKRIGRLRGVPSSGGGREGVPGIFCVARGVKEFIKSKVYRARRGLWLVVVLLLKINGYPL